MKVKIKRQYNILDGLWPLKVKFDGETVEELGNGEEAIVSVPEQAADMSVGSIYKRSRKIRVKNGDVVSIERHWIFYVVLMFLVLTGIVPILLNMLGVNLGPYLNYFFALFLITVVTGALMKSYEVKVIGKMDEEQVINSSG